MKKFAKKTSPGLFVFLFVIGAMTFFSCQKEQLQPKSDAVAHSGFKVLALNDAPGMPEYDALVAPLPFDFNIEMSKCKNVKPSITLKVTVKDNGNEVKHAQPKYKYQWKVDGAEAGTSAELGCFCAKNATVIVTRLADNKKVAKSVRLYVCDTGEAVGNYEEE